MSLRKPLSCCLMVLALLLACSAGAQAKSEVISRYILAVMTRDTDTLQKILADNYLHINANGFLQDREHFIENLKNGTMVIDHLTFFDTVETQYVGAVVLTGNVIFKGKFKTKLPEGLQRATIVADGAGEKAKILLYQATPVLDRKESRAAARMIKERAEQQANQEKK